MLQSPIFAAQSIINMKFILPALSAVCLAIAGCTSTKTVTVPAVPAEPAPLFANALDSFSYAIGLSISNFYKEQGVDSINDQLVLTALTDSRLDSSRFTDEEVNTTIIGYMDQLRAKKAEQAKAEGVAFLQENKTKEGVIELPSGLQYQVLTAGTGEKPGVNDKVKVHYTGKLLNGKVFDSSVERGEPIELGVTQVIKGWTEALQLMPVGSKWKLFIPSELAYGDNAAGPDIKPGSTLIFEVELLDIIR